MTVIAPSDFDGRPRLLVFDLDGTLVPTMDDYADKAAALMEDAFATPFAAARRAYFATSGLPFEQQLRQLYPDRTDSDAVAARFESWKDGYLRSVALAPDTATLLESWRGAGFRIAISSNNLEVYVERMARDWPVDAALGYRAHDGFGKGEDHFRTLEQRFGADRSTFLFVGDSPNDARIAARAGVPFRALLTSAFSAEDFDAAVPGTLVLDDLAALTLTFSAGVATG